MDARLSRSGNLAAAVVAAAASTNALTASAAEGKTLEALREMYPLRYLGDEALRTPCEDVPPECIPSAELARLCAALEAQRSRWLGLGLAANQVGSRWRVFVVGRTDAPQFFVNPRFTGEYGPAKKWPGEGSLSIPHFRTSTIRHESVGLEWSDPVINVRTRAVFTGRHAQVVEHLMDQLDGKLIIDGVSRQQRRDAERMTDAHVAKLLKRV